MTLFLAALGLGLVVLVLNRTRWRLDHDAGGYRPAFGNMASYPKAYVHFISGYAFALGLTVATGMAWQSALAVTVLAVLWEFSAGFVNPLDMLASALGAWSGYLNWLVFTHTVRHT